MHAYLLTDEEVPFVFSRLAYDQLIEKCECWSDDRCSFCQWLEDCCTRWNMRPADWLAKKTSAMARRMMKRRKVK